MIATSRTNGYLPKRPATICMRSTFCFSVIIEPRDRPAALATKAGSRDGEKPEVPGTNAIPTLTGRVNTGVPDTTGSSVLGYRNSAVLVTFRAVFAHPASTSRTSSEDAVLPQNLPLGTLSMVPPFGCQKQLLASSSSLITRNLRGESGVG